MSHLAAVFNGTGKCNKSTVTTTAELGLELIENINSTEWNTIFTLHTYLQFISQNWNEQKI